MCGYGTMSRRQGARMLGSIVSHFAWTARHISLGWPNVTPEGGVTLERESLFVDIAAQVAELAHPLCIHRARELAPAFVLGPLVCHPHGVFGPD